MEQEDPRASSPDMCTPGQKQPVLKGSSRHWEVEGLLKSRPLALVWKDLGDCRNPFSSSLVLKDINIKFGQLN